MVCFSVVNCSTNEVYHAFLANQIDKYVGLGYFSLFGFITTYYLVFKSLASSTKKTVLSPLKEVGGIILKIDNLGKWLILSLIPAYLGYFIVLLESLDHIDSFTIVVIGGVTSLLNVSLGIFFFKDKIQNYISFFSALLLALIGVGLFTYFDSKQPPSSSQAISNSYKYGLLVSQIIFGLYGDIVKTHLRRSYKINPERLTLLPYAAAVLLSITIYIVYGGSVPSFLQFLVLAYIGIFPTALFNIYNQKMKDVIGIPIVSLISIPRPIYILVVQLVLFYAAPIINLTGLYGNYTNPFDKSIASLFSTFIILFGIYLSGKYGKPEIRSVSQ